MHLREAMQAALFNRGAKLITFRRENALKSISTVLSINWFKILSTFKWTVHRCVVDLTEVDHSAQSTGKIGLWWWHSISFFHLAGQVNILLPSIAIWLNSIGERCSGSLIKVTASSDADVLVCFELMTEGKEHCFLSKDSFKWLMQINRYSAWVFKYRLSIDQLNVRWWPAISLS